MLSPGQVKGRLCTCAHLTRPYIQEACAACALAKKMSAVSLLHFYPEVLNSFDRFLHSSSPFRHTKKHHIPSYPPLSSTDDDARLVSSRFITPYSDFRMPATAEDHPTIPDYVEYLQAYAEHFNVTPLIEYGAKVGVQHRWCSRPVGAGLAAARCRCFVCVCVCVLVAHLSCLLPASEESNAYITSHHITAQHITAHHGDAPRLMGHVHTTCIPTHTPTLIIGRWKRFPRLGRSVRARGIPCSTPTSQPGRRRRLCAVPSASVLGCTTYHASPKCRGWSSSKGRYCTRRSTCGQNPP